MQRIAVNPSRWHRSALSTAFLCSALLGTGSVLPASEAEPEQPISTPTWDQIDAAEPTVAGELLQRLVTTDAGIIRESERIAALLRDPSAALRRDACQALARLRDEQQAAALIDRLSDSDQRVRHEARNALIAIAGQDHGVEVDAWQRWYARHQQDADQARAIAERLVDGQSDHLNADLATLLSFRSHRRIIVGALEELLLHPNRRVHLLAGKALQGVEGGMARDALQQAVASGLLASAFRRPPPELVSRTTAPQITTMTSTTPIDTAAAETGLSTGAIFFGSLAVALLALLTWPVISQYRRHHRAVTEHTRRFTRSIQRQDR